MTVRSSRFIKQDHYSGDWAIITTNLYILSDTHLSSRYTAIHGIKEGRRIETSSFLTAFNGESGKEKRLIYRCKPILYFGCFYNGILFVMGIGVTIKSVINSRGFGKEFIRLVMNMTSKA